MNMMQMMRATIRQTWAVQKAHRQSAEAYRILLEAIWQKDGPDYLQCGQQVDDSMSGWVSGENALSSIRGQNRLKQLQDGPLHWETVGANFLVIFEDWLPVDDFDNAHWIRRHWVKMLLKKCRREIREARQKGRQGNPQPATD